jgi:hypothetical protein
MIFNLLNAAPICNFEWPFTITFEYLKNFWFIYYLYFNFLGSITYYFTYFDYTTGFF